MQLKKTILFAVFFFAISISYSQRTKISVELNVENGAFKTEDLARIPFDETFYIDGVSTNKDLTKVEVFYAIKEYDPVRHYFIDSNSINIDGYVEAGSADIINGRFKFLAPKLHPNEDYIFKFDFFETVNLPEEENKKLRLSIVAAIGKLVSYKNETISPDEVELFRSTVVSDIESATNKKPLFDENNQAITDLSSLIFGDSSIESSYKSLTKYNADIFEKRSKLLAAGVTPPASDGFVYKILQELNAKEVKLLAAINTTLSEASLADRIKEPVNVLIEPNLTLKVLLEFLRDDYARGNFNLTKNTTNFPSEDVSDIRDASQRMILEVLSGNAKLKGSVIDPSVGFDKESFQLLLAGFIQLQNLKKADGTPVIANNELDEITRLLLICLQSFNEIEAELAKIDLETNTHVNILEDLYSCYSFKVIADTGVPINTQETPYVGIDFGVLVAPDISSTFLFEGINFHLRPVNRRAKFSDLKGIDKWLKQTSIAFGVAQRVGSYDDNYKNLIGIGSPYVGIGYRINRMIRLNGGALFYEVDNPNPLIGRTNVKTTYFLSASIDIELKNALQIVGNFVQQSL